MTRPFVKRFTQQQRFELPTIRTTKTMRTVPTTGKTIELKSIETLIAGRIDKKLQPNFDHQALLKGTRIATHGNIEFIQRTGMNAMLRILAEDPNANKDILEKLKGKNGIFVQGVVVTIENQGTLRQFFERIERIARARKLGFIYSFTVKKSVWRTLESLGYTFVHENSFTKSGYWVKLLN